MQNLCSMIARLSRNRPASPMLIKELLPVFNLSLQVGTGHRGLVMTLMRSLNPLLIHNRHQSSSFLALGSLKVLP